MRRGEVGGSGRAGGNARLRKVSVEASAGAVQRSMYAGMEAAAYQLGVFSEREMLLHVC